ncbi:MAG: hypothetical protein ACREHG_05390 [Candidatus Saccharimonadales bacterium]
MNNAIAAQTGAVYAGPGTVTSYNTTPASAMNWLSAPTQAVSEQTAMAYNFTSASQNNALNFLGNTMTSQNNYLYTLLGYQSVIAGQIGKTEAAALSTAASKIAPGSRGGLLGALGF